MHDSALQLETLAKLAALHKQKAQSALAAAQRDIAVLQAKIDGIRGRSSVDPGTFDLGFAAASERWPQSRNALLIPVQMEMAKCSAIFRSLSRDAAEASASLEVIEARLELARAAERKLRDAKRQEHWFQERLCFE